MFEKIEQNTMARYGEAGIGRLRNTKLSQLEGAIATMRCLGQNIFVERKRTLSSLALAITRLLQESWKQAPLAKVGSVQVDEETRIVYYDRREETREIKMRVCKEEVIGMRAIINDEGENLRFYFVIPITGDPFYRVYRIVEDLETKYA